MCEVCGKKNLTTKGAKVFNTLVIYKLKNFEKKKLT